MRRLGARSQQGITLIELCICVSVIALIALTGLPDMRSYVTNSRLKEAGTVIVTSSLYARSEAIKRNTRVRVSVQGSVLSVGTMNGAVETVLRSEAIPPSVSAAGFQADFNGTGRLTPFGSSLNVSLSPAIGSCDGDTHCPTVRIDAGGAVSQCMPGACV